MKFLKNLFDSIYLKCTEKSFDSGVQMGILIGELGERSKIYRLFDAKSKRKLSQLEVIEMIESLDD